MAERDIYIVKKWFDQNLLTLHTTQRKVLTTSLRDKGGKINSLKLLIHMKRLTILTLNVTQ